MYNGFSPAAFLAALQLADSAFPTGMYAHSQGLEGMIRRGWVTNAGELQELLEGQLVWSFIPADGLALLRAHEAFLAGDLERVVAIDGLLHASKAPAELRAASRQMGKRLLTETHPFTETSLYRDRVAAGDAPGLRAVALGVIAAGLDIPAAGAALGMCHSHVTGMLGAALRLMPITHSQTQGILHHLHPIIASTLEAVSCRSWEEISSFTPQLDLASFGHEHDEIRMFAS